MKKRVIAGAVTALMVLSLIGCNKTEETKATATTAAETETEETYKAIGTEKETEKTYAVDLKNSTGQDITGVSVKTMDAAEFPANMLAAGDIYTKGETRTLYYEMAAETQQGEAGDKVMDAGYDIMVTFADGSTKVLHAFPFSDIGEGEVCLEDDVVFVKYKSAANGQNISTKEAEITVKQAEEAAAQAAAAEAEAAAAAQEAPVEEYYEEEYVEDYSYSDDYSADYSGDTGAVDNSVPAAPTQDSEACLGDVALTY